MGSIPAPDFANLSLAIDEYRFVKNMIRQKRFNILVKLNNLWRYLDDIGMPNFPEFEQIVLSIYHPTLSLSKSNQDSSLLNVAYLDMSVSVVNNDFHVKIYCKKMITVSR